MAQELARRVREKYPGAYDDMSDEDLEAAVLAKYPQYEDLATKSEPGLLMQTLKEAITPFGPGQKLIEKGEELSQQFGEIPENIFEDPGKTLKAAFGQSIKATTDLAGFTMSPAGVLSLIPGVGVAARRARAAIPGVKAGTAAIPTAAAPPAQAAAAVKQATPRLPLVIEGAKAQPGVLPFSNTLTAQALGKQLPRVPSQAPLGAADEVLATRTPQAQQTLNLTGISGVSETTATQTAANITKLTTQLKSTGSAFYMAGKTADQVRKSPQGVAVAKAAQESVEDIAGIWTKASKAIEKLGGEKAAVPLLALTRAGGGIAGGTLGAASGETTPQKITRGTMGFVSGVFLPKYAAQLFGKGVPLVRPSKVITEALQPKGIGAKLDQSRYTLMLAGPAMVKALEGSLATQMVVGAKFMIEGNPRAALNIFKRMVSMADDGFLQEFYTVVKDPNKAKIIGKLTDRAHAQGKMGGPYRIMMAGDDAGRSNVAKEGFDPDEAANMMLAGIPTSTFGRKYVDFVSNSFLKWIEPFSKVSAISGEQWIRFGPLGFSRRISNFSRNAPKGFKGGPEVKLLSDFDRRVDAALGTTIGTGVGAFLGDLQGKKGEMEGLDYLKRGIATAATGPMMVQTLLAFSVVYAAETGRSIPTEAWRALTDQLPATIGAGVRLNDWLRVPSQWIPTFLSTIARFQDDVQRDTSHPDLGPLSEIWPFPQIAGPIIAKIPGARQKLLPPREEGLGSLGDLGSLDEL